MKMNLTKGQITYKMLIGKIIDFTKVINRNGGTYEYNDILHFTNFDWNFCWYNILIYSKLHKKEK